MNNYLYNQIRRSEAPAVKKIIGFLMGVLCPAKNERAWRKHVTEMQNRLNENNWKRHGFYVSGGELCLDWTVYTNYGYFAHRQK